MGTPIIAVLNLMFWFITVMWFLGQPAVIEEVFPVHLLPGAGRAHHRQLHRLYMNLIAMREDDRPDLLVPAPHRAAVLADDEHRLGQGLLSADPQSVVLGEDLPRSGGQDRRDHRAPGGRSAMTAGLGGSDRRLKFTIFFVCLVVYVGVGTGCRSSTGYIMGDTLSRVASTRAVLFSRDPHLAALGFIFTPVAAMVQIPAVAAQPGVPATSPVAPIRLDDVGTVHGRRGGADLQHGCRSWSAARIFTDDHRPVRAQPDDRLLRRPTV